MQRGTGNRKPSLGALTYVVPSRRQQPSPPRQQWNNTDEARLGVERLAIQRSFLVPPAGWMQREHFADPRSSETREVLPPGHRHVAAGVVHSSVPARPGRLQLQGMVPSSEDTYEYTDSSSSYWESRLSSEDATMIMMTGTNYGNLTFNKDITGHRLMYTAPARWTESGSSYTLEDPSTHTAATAPHEEHRGSNGGDCGTEDPPAVSRSTWQSCLPAVGLMVLTSLLLGAAVTTVLRMKDILPLPTEALQGTPQDGGLGEVERMMTPRKLLVQPTIAAFHRRGTFRSAHYQAAVEGARGREETDMSSFEGVPAVLGSRLTEEDSHLRRAYKPLPENVTPSPPKIRTRPHACREVSFTYCTGSASEFFYSSSTDSCMLASENLVQLCNRGRNKFTSKRRCKMSCLSAEEPDPNCLEKPLFSACRSDDIKPSPWYFDGKRCTPWGFPSGRCPSNDSAVFATASACTSRCSDQRYAACSLPRTVNCKYKQLRFPYFADRSPEDGRVRCLAASAPLLKGRLCLDGLNRFNTSRACEDACRKTTT